MNKRYDYDRSLINVSTRAIAVILILCMMCSPTYGKKRKKHRKNLDNVMPSFTHFNDMFEYPLKLQYQHDLDSMKIRIDSLEGILNKNQMRYMQMSYLWGRENIDPVSLYRYSSDSLEASRMVEALATLKYPISKNKKLRKIELTQKCKDSLLDNITKINRLKKKNDSLIIEIDNELAICNPSYTAFLKHPKHKIWDDNAVLIKELELKNDSLKLQLLEYLSSSNVFTSDMLNQLKLGIGKYNIRHVLPKINFDSSKWSSVCNENTTTYKAMQGGHGYVWKFDSLANVEDSPYKTIYFRNQDTHLIGTKHSMRKRFYPIKQNLLHDTISEIHVISQTKFSIMYEKRYFQRTRKNVQDTFNNCFQSFMYYTDTFGICVDTVALPDTLNIGSEYTVSITAHKYCSNKNIKKIPLRATFINSYTDNFCTIKAANDSDMVLERSITWSWNVKPIKQGTTKFVFSLRNLVLDEETERILPKDPLDISKQVYITESLWHSITAFFTPVITSIIAGFVTLISSILIGLPKKVWLYFVSKRKSKPQENGILATPVVANRETQ